MPGGKILLYPKQGAPFEYELCAIQYHVQANGVAVCLWDDHKTRNAITPSMLAETFAVLEHMARDDNVKAAVWGGRNNFGSGMAFKKAGSLEPTKVPKAILKDYGERDMAPDDNDIVLGKLTAAFWDFPKPSIAAVQGFAIGGCANLALMNQHDMVVVAEDARFFYPFVKLGLVPELSSSFLLPYMVGLPRAKELLLLGNDFSGKKAFDLGLANRVVPASQVWDVALGLAGEFAAMKNQFSLRTGKKLINSHLRKKLDDVFAREKEALRASITSIGGPPVFPSKKKPAAKL